MRKYRIKFENRRYKGQIKKWFFFWVDVGESIDGYSLVPTYGSSIGAMQYLQRWDWDKFRNTNYRIEG